MRKIVEFFASEHLLGNLITLVILGVGLASLFSLQRDVFPKVDFEVTSVTLVMPGASPEQVEKLLVSPIEEALREVDGIKKIFSTSTEGTGVVIMQLDSDARDPEKTNDDIQQAIDTVKDLPEEAEDPIVNIVDTSTSPIIEVTVAGKLSGLELREVSKFVRDELLEVKGVARVVKNGFREREYFVEADPKKLAEKRISLSSLISAISNNNISLPAGSVKDTNGNEVLIKTDAELVDIEQILNTPINSNDEGFVTKVRDVATVKEKLEDPVYLYRANGKSSINLVVLKKENADVLKMVEKISEKVKELRERVPAGVELGLANDFSVYVKNRIKVLSSNLLIGLVLVVFFLTLLLPLQVSMVVAVGIPVAMFSTIICMAYLGISINLISLIGLIIVLGMVVDDAIVVCENVWRYYEMGYKPLQAVSAGTLEVIPPITASVLTTMIAFAPLASMPGIMGKFIFQIPIVVILALAFSLLEAIIVMPSHFASWVKVPSAKESISQKKKKAGWFDAVVDMYGKYVSWSMRQRYVVLAIMFWGLVASGFIINKYARFILFPPVGIQTFFIKMEAPKSFSLEATEAYVAQVEKEVLKLPKEEVTDVISMIGISRQDANDPLTKRGSNYAQLQVILTPENDRDRIAAEIIEELKKNIQLDRNDVKLNYVEMKGGPPQGRPVSIDILGENFDYLLTVAKEIEAELQKMEHVRDIENSYVKGKDQINIKPISDKMAAAQLSAREVSLNVRAAFDGVVASSVRDLEDEISIRVGRKSYNDSIEAQLNSLKVGNPLGNLINLNAISKFEKESSVSAIFHKTYKRTLNVSADVDIKETTSNETIAALQPFLEDLQKRHKNIKIEIGGENEDTKESMEGLMKSFVLAFIGIATLLIVTFRKIIQPVVILFTIPMGVIGVVYALMLHGRPLSFMAMLGVVALAGVIVNNAIVLITFINALRKDGLNRYQSIIEAARTRLRPIFMTTLTTVSGLLPTAYGLGGSDPFIKPLALSLGWGLALGSFFIALFFPVLISLLDDVYYYLEVFFKKRHRKNRESIS
jgi:multidrug efflux pump subunit AcrB